MSRYYVRLSVSRNGVDETKASKIVWADGFNVRTPRAALAAVVDLRAELERAIEDHEVKHGAGITVTFPENR